MLRIDFDQYRRRPCKLIEMLYNLPRPYKVRLSSSRKGLHIIRECGACDDDCEYCYWRKKYSDNKRHEHDARKLPGSSRDLLWKKKKGREAGEWIEIKTSENVEFFIERILSMNDSFKYSCFL